MRKKLASLVLTATLLSVAAGGSAAYASTTDVTPVEDYGPVVIDGRTFGLEEGLVVEGGEIELPRANSASTLRAAAAATVAYKEGASYAKTKERLQLWYDGESKAGANVVGKKRIVEVCFKYTRGGENVSGNQCSKASPIRNTSWEAGAVRKKSVRDSLNPRADKTKFAYWTKKINSTS